MLAGLTANNTQYLKSTSAALYGQLSWKLTDALTVQPGLRVNYDKKTGFYQRLVTTADGSLLTCPQPAGSVGAARCGVYQPQLTSPSVSDWNFSYDFNVNYKVAPDVLVYATYAKSFKTVGINQNGLPTDANNNPILSAGVIKPESDKIVVAVKKNGVPVEYVVFDDEGHGFTKKKNQIEGYGKVLIFLDKYLRSENP